MSARMRRLLNDSIQSGQFHKNSLKGLFEEDGCDINNFDGLWDFLQGKNYVSTENTEVLELLKYDKRIIKDLR